MASTPNMICNARGISMPSLDTQYTMGSHDKLSMALSYHGCLTPPQSAHESRRPSLASSLLADPSYSGSSSVSAYSQPATPVYGTQQSEDTHFGRRAASGLLQGELAFSVLSSYQSTQPPSYFQADQQLSFQTDFSCATGAEDLPLSAHHGTPHFDIDGLPGMTANISMPVQDLQDNWDAALHAPHAATHAQTLRAPLFSLNEDFRLLPSSATTSFDTSLASTYDSMCGTSSTFNPCHQGHQIPASFLERPAVIVPSHAFFNEQSFPEDYTPVRRGNVGFDGESFDSVSSSFNYEVVEPQIPDDAYGAYSDEEVYTPCKMETSPTPSTQRRTAGRTSTGAKCVKTTPSRARARQDRRARQRKGPCKEVRIKDIDWKLECEIYLDNDDRIKGKKVGGGGEKKKFCTFGADEYGQGGCGAGFERSEHLKRHFLMHRADDPYPCPLPGCKKVPTRSDNACDHFKTHLKPRKTGSRNNHCEWTELQDLITQTFSHDRAKKLLDNLRRWKNGHPEFFGN